MWIQDLWIRRAMSIWKDTQHVQFSHLMPVARDRYWGKPISGIQRPVRLQAPTRREMNHSSGPQSFSVDTQPHYVGTITIPAPQSSLWILLKQADHSPSKEDMVQPPPGHVPSRQAWRSDSDLIRSRTHIYQHFQLQEAPCSPKHSELVDLD